MDRRIRNLSQLPLTIIDPVVIGFSTKGKHRGSEDLSFLFPDSALSLSDITQDHFFRRITILPLIQTAFSHRPLGIMNDGHDIFQIFFFSCTISHTLIWFRRYGRRHLQVPGRYMHGHSGSGPDVRSRSECPDVPCEVSPVLPEQQ